jgi:hypothetical protein
MALPHAVAEYRINGYQLANAKRDHRKIQKDQRAWKRASNFNSRRPTAASLRLRRHPHVQTGNERAANKAASLLRRSPLEALKAFLMICQVAIVLRDLLVHPLRA